MSSSKCNELQKVYGPEDFRALVTAARAAAEPELDSPATVVCINTRAVIA